MCNNLYCAVITQYMYHTNTLRSVWVYRSSAATKYPCTLKKSKIVDRGTLFFSTLDDIFMPNSKTLKS